MADDADQQQLAQLRKGVLWLTERNRELEARIAKLEAALKPVAQAVSPVEQVVSSVGQAVSPAEQVFVGQAVSPAIPPEVPQAPPPPTAPRFVPQPPAVPPPLLPPPALETQVGLNYLNRFGVVTLILGAIFFFKYAVDNDWIGPGARVAIGILAAAVALFSADLLWKRGQKIFAQGLTGLGLSLLYLSFWASFGLYHLLPQSVAFGLMIVTTAASAVFALRYDAQAIAILGQVGAYLTPVALSTGEDHPWILFSYVFLVNLGGLAAARYKRWRFAEWLAFAATVILYFGWATTWLKIDNRPVATFFLVAFYLQFASAQSRAVWIVAQLLAAGGSVIWDNYVAGIALAVLFAIGGLIVADLRQWREGPTWTLACYWVAYGIINSQRPLEKPIERIVGMLTLGFAVFFAWSPWWTLIRKRTLRQTDLAVMVANAALYFGACYTLLQPGYQAYMGLFAVVMGVAHLALARVLWKPESDPERALWAPMLAVAVTLAFLTLAMPIQFTGFRITIAWALEGAALAWLAARFRTRRMAVAAGLVLLLAISRLSGFDALMYSTGSQYAALANTRFLVFIVTAAGLFLAAKFFLSLAREAAAASYIAGHVVLLVALVLEVIGWAERTAPNDLISLETTSVSILLALYGVALIVIGVVAHSAFNRLLGLGLMGLVIIKLYLSDVWILGKMFRITAFLGLGILLLLVSFLYSRFRHVIERLLKDDASA